MNLTNKVKYNVPYHLLHFKVLVENKHKYPRQSLRYVNNKIRYQKGSTVERDVDSFQTDGK
jgi:hypothetical protein